MKLFIGNGRTLDVRDVGPVMIQLSARKNGPPIKLNGHHLMSDDEARDVLRDLLSTGLYDRMTFTDDPSQAAQPARSR